LVVVRGLGGKLRQCSKCGWVDRAADRVCANCGAERKLVALRAVVPELARRYGVPVEVVAGEAARKLQEVGGIGAYLR
jgi:peptide subunit release factor 1 (eRF1)